MLSERVCAGDVRGYLIDNGLDVAVHGHGSTPVPGEAALGGVLGISQRVHLLYPDDPAAWTTHPLR